MTDNAAVVRGTMLRLRDALRLERPPHARSQKANNMGIP